MKIRKSELKNIIDLNWDIRRKRSKERSARNSEMAKEWKKRTLKVRRLVAELEKSKNPEQQAEGHLIKKMLELISYDFYPNQK